MKTRRAYNWPGNIRELKNLIECAVILCDSYELDEPLPYNIQYIATQRPNYALSAFDPSLVEKLHIQRLLNHTNGNRAKAAGLLNIGIAILLSR